MSPEERFRVSCGSAGRASLDSARRCPAQNGAQVVGGLELCLGKAITGHADVIQQFELVRASYRQLVLLLSDDSVVEGLDRQVSRPVLQQQPLVLRSVVLARSRLDELSLGRTCAISP